MGTSTRVTLYRPDGGTVVEFNDIDQVTRFSKDMIEFRQRRENGDVVTVLDYTSNLPYLIVEHVDGPKGLL